MARTQELTIGSRRGRALPALFVLTLAAVASACGSSTDPVGVSGNQSLSEMADSELGAVLADMTTGIGLSDAQSSEIAGVADEFGSRLEEPGMLWYVAADLQGILNSDQIERISASRPEVMERIRSSVAEQFGFNGGFFGGGDGGFGAGGFPGNGRLGGFLGSDDAPDCSEIGDVFGGRFGGGRGGHGMGAGFGLGGLGFGGFGFGSLDGIELTDDQISALRSIMMEFGPRMLGLTQQRRDGLISDDELREQAEAIGEQTQEAIENVLTAEQIAAIENLKESREEAAEAERAARIDVLGLTDQQFSDLEALRENLAEEACETIVAGGSPEDLRDLHHQAVAQILTDAQLETIQLHGSLGLYYLVHRIESGDLEGFGRRFGR
jgi:Spy/CpxP family protein refolding chaperone